MTLSKVLGASTMTNPEEAAAAGPAPRRPRILVVDDHDIGRKSLVRLLEALGYEVVSAKDGASALEAMSTTSVIDYVLTDLRLPDIDGRDVVLAARKRVPAPRIALITGWDIEPEESERLGIDWVFLKPLDVPSIVASLRKASPPDPAPAAS